jgi:hypothetical protein
MSELADIECLDRFYDQTLNPDPHEHFGHLVRQARRCYLLTELVKLMRCGAMVSIFTGHAVWKARYGGMDVSEAQEAKQLRDENTKLKKPVAELALDKQILKDIAEGTF